MTWHNLRLLITSPPEPNLDAVAAASVDAIVLQSTGQSVSAGSIAATRPELPLIVLAEVDEPTSLRLIAAGADEVLAPATPLAEILRGIQRAVTRKQRVHES